MAHQEVIDIRDEDDSSSATDEEDHVATMAEMFPAVPRSRIQRVVTLCGASRNGKIIDELLKLTDESSDSSGCSSRGASPVTEPPLKRNKLEDDLNGSFLEDMSNSRCQLLRSCLPDADPEYLKRKAQDLQNESDFQRWLNRAMDKHDYPTLIDYLKRKECKDTLETYCRMTAEEFLNAFPGGDDPGAHFSRQGRIAPSKSYEGNVANFLNIIFPDAEESAVKEALGYVRGLLVPAVHYLEAAGHDRGEMPSCEAFETDGALDLIFMQEMTFLRLEPDIESLLTVRKLQQEEAKLEARESGALFECPICGEEEVLLNDILECSTGQHMFCSTCVGRQAEVVASETRSVVSCLESGCEGHFSLSQLRGIIGPGLFDNLVRMVQQSELRKAEVDALLEACPFCGFSCEIEDQHLEVFVCLNPVCRIDSCRKCKKVAHGSVPCEKAEDDAQTQARLLLEEKLTAAIVRHCPQCKREVLKVEGCNHMTCPCGTHFCYVCRQEFAKKELSRHYLPGKPCEKFEDSANIHERNLAEAVQKGKEEVQEKFGGVQLVHDPTADVLPAERGRQYNIDGGRRRAGRGRGRIFLPNID